MRVIFYFSENGIKESRIAGMAQSITLKAETTIVRTIERLVGALRQPTVGPTLAVLFTRSRQDLQRIVGVKALLFETPVILILPDRKEKNVLAGHSLAPRFLTDQHANWDDVAAVLEKMIQNYEAKGRVYNRNGVQKKDF